MFGADNGGAILAYVTRNVIGDVPINRTVYNEDTQRNDKVASTVKDPVLVFFPSGSSQVLSAKDAERKGYLQTPTILNFETVDKPDTIAGRFKFAMNDDDRAVYWEQMEKAVISSCMGRGGYPLPRTVEYSENSIWVKSPAANKRKAA